MVTQRQKHVRDLLNEFDAEIGAAIGSFHAWKAINQLAAMAREIHRGLNANARFWNLFLHTCQVTLFVTLGRIFDRTRGTFTVHRFIADCKARVGEFTPASFEARRTAENHGVRPDYLDDFMQTYYAAQAKDFDALEKEVAPYATRFEAIYKPIRDNLMAHRSANAGELTDDLFGATEIHEVEKVLEFLHRVWAVVNELYLNGRKTGLTGHRYRRGETMEADIESLLLRVAAQR
jgi:AbiU2